ncbi:hypothetical protein [Microbacterium amylolyticum]|uniref:Uncharacterized protein n=1 Tax=Microbacterium amylolyticum TaxID=936337 RepID=A0ABS4ZGA6_9MICO|nr:hypothetical protein [Microbacterium amylolyticum]MBP2436317.1 hypothetical protein [Microbacterium amylolyticum]
MSRRTRSVLIAAGLFALSILVGVILESVWLGVFLGLIVGVVALIGMQSKKGGHQGLSDDDNGAAL